MENISGEVGGKEVAGTGETEQCASLILHCATFRRRGVSDQKESLLEAFSDSCCKLLPRTEEPGRAV